MAKTKELQLKWLLLGNFIVSVGTSFMWPLTTVYMHDYLGKSLTTAGIVLFFNSLSLIIGSYIGGYIYDHYDARKFLLASLALASLSVFMLIFFNGWPAYPIFLILDNFGGGIASTIVNSLATAVKGKDARYIFNMMYFMANIGVVIGTLLVGYVVDINIELIFIINFSLYVVFLILAFYHYFVPQHVFEGRKNPTAKEGLKTSKKYIIVIFTILALYVAVGLGYSQWQSNLSVYMRELGIALHKYSFLWTINGIIIVTAQPIISWCDDHFNVNIWHKLYFGGGMFAVAFASLIIAKDYPHFVLSMCLVTLAEVFTFPTIPAIVDDLSSVGEKGRYQGFVRIASSCGSAVGPLIGGLIIDSFSYTVLFMVMASFIFLTVIGILVAVKTNLRS